MLVRPNRLLLFLLLCLLPLPAFAQSEGDLRRFFEGKTVVLRIDMPASKLGVDIYPGSFQPLDYAELGKRLKAHGTALRAGQSVLVTQVKVKERNIEFQLAGGGYGTVGDDTSTEVILPPSPKTQREKNLEKELKTVTDPEKRRKIKEELDSLRREREREDARQQAIGSIASEQKRAAVRQRALEAGSRFNLWYPQGLSSEHLRPAAVMDALAAYVEFPFATQGAVGTARPTALRKGLLLEEVESLLGKPPACTEQSQGDLRVLLCTYLSSEGQVEATFVEGVLVRYTVSSR
jgi:hypothetical protein